MSDGGSHRTTSSFPCDPAAVIQCGSCMRGHAKLCYRATGSTGSNGKRTRQLGVVIAVETSRHEKTGSLSSACDCCWPGSGLASYFRPRCAGRSLRGGRCQRHDLQIHSRWHQEHFRLRALPALMQRRTCCVRSLAVSTTPTAPYMAPYSRALLVDPHRQSRAF